MKKINLKELPIKNIEGEEEKIDISKELAILLYQKAQSLPVHVAAQDLYREGHCEKSQEVIDALRAILDEIKPAYYMRVAIEAAIA